MQQVCFIGGVNFDESALADALERLPQGTLVVTGNGRGAETWIRTHAPDYGLNVYVPDFVSSERQVADVYVQALTGGHLVLVGDGFRVREARGMLSRSSAWPMEVVEL